VVQEGGGQPVELCQRLRNLWGLGGKAQGYGVKVRAGKLEEERYMVKLRGEKGVQAEFPPQKFLPNGLIPVVVEGVNENWTAGILDKEKNFYPGGVLEGKLYLGVEKNWQGKLLFLGNPLLSDRKEVRVEILKLDKSRLSFQIHNPTGEIIKGKVYPSPLSFLRPFSQKFSLKPGETAKVNILNP